MNVALMEGHKSAAGSKKVKRTDLEIRTKGGKVKECSVRAADKKEERSPSVIMNERK